MEGDIKQCKRPHPQFTVNRPFDKIHTVAGTGTSLVLRSVHPDTNDTGWLVACGDAQADERPKEDGQSIPKRPPSQRCRQKRADKLCAANNRLLLTVAGSITVGEVPDKSVAFARFAIPTTSAATAAVFPNYRVIFIQKKEAFVREEPGNAPEKAL